MVAVLGHRDERGTAVGRKQERLRAGAEHAVSALELGAIDREVGLVDESVRVPAVLRIARDADRDGGPDRLAGRLHVEGARRDGAPDPLGDLERLLGRRLRQQDRELFAAEARRHVVVAQLGPEHLCDALEHRVARQVPVGVVDLAEEVEVGHDQRQRPLEPLRAAELFRQRRGEVARVEEAGLRVDARLRLELRHRECAVDQQQRCDREGDEPRVPEPERGQHDAERREHELRGEGLVGEELAHRVPVDPADHGREQRGVEDDEHDRGHRAGEREADVVARDESVRLEHEVGAPPRRHRRDREDEDVGGLHVPRATAAQPLGDVLDQRHQGQQRRRNEQHRGDQEDAGRVVRLVARRAHDEELRHREAARRGSRSSPSPLCPGRARRGKAQ